MKHLLKKRMPTAVTHRLPTYLSFLRERNGQRNIRSHEIAHGLGLTPSTVRQDFTHLNISGVAKKGYDVNTLTAILASTLGLSPEKLAVVVGAGNIGTSVAQHQTLRDYGFRVNAIVDCNPDVIGRKVGHLTVKHIDCLPDITRKGHIDIGIIAVPAESAQQAADRLIMAGIKGLLNLAPTRIVTPRFARVIDVRLTHGLMLLSHFLSHSRP